MPRQDIFSVPICQIDNSDTVVLFGPGAGSICGYKVHRGDKGIVSGQWLASNKACPVW
jgi:hypothetical protein